MPAKGKCRDRGFQDRIDTFTKLLHKKFGLKKSGTPEKKKEMRHSVCPKCDMKNIAESVGCKIYKKLFVSMHM